MIATLDAAWLYTRDEEAVRLEVTTDGPTMRLGIYGPGAAFTSVDFSERVALTTFQQAFADDLLKKGFRLHATSERRRGPGEYPRLVENRRR